jgi:copper chaperone CopZ
VADALKAVPGVQVEKVEIGRATIALDSPATGPQAVVEALAKAGYAARPVQANG